MPGEPIRPSSRRGASGAWNRLKPVRDDSLEAYGLPSKGETRLNDFKTQEIYSNRILERYLKFCASTPSTTDLSASFASLRLSPPPSLRDHNSSSSSTPTSEDAPSLPLPPTTRLTPGPNNSLPSILLALRKLREAITATGRRDAFALRTYTFAIRTAILCSDWSSYSPALTHLLFSIHPVTPLSAPEHHEHLTYHILDLACRQGNLSSAHAIRVAYNYKDRRVEAVLKALARDNWVQFWKVKRAVDGYQRRVMEFAEREVRVHALKCLGKSYMSCDKAFVERCAERGWEELVEDGVGWELVEGDRAVIRRPKAR